MTTRQEYATQPIVERLAHLARTANEIGRAIHGRGHLALYHRPDGKNWAATEIICHLRDIEELFMIRFRTMLAMEEPKFLVLGEMPMDAAAWGLVPGDSLPLDPDRWAEERQYHRNDPVEAAAALRRRRGETLSFLHRLTLDQWRRGSIHSTLGRMTFEDWVALAAAHDDNHLGQLRRALNGQV